MTTEPIPSEVGSDVQILAAISELMGTSLPFEEVITNAMQFASSTLGVDGSSLLLVHPKEGDLYYTIPLGAKADQLKKIQLAKGEGIAGFVVESGRPLVVSDVTREPHFSKRLDQMTKFKTRSIVCVPLRVGDDLIGAIGVVSRNNKEALGDKDLDKLTAISGPVAMMIQNARFISEIKSLHDQLGEAYRAKTEFLASMTHELRTPLNIVIGNLDLLLGGFVGDLNDRQRESIKTSLRNSGEVLNLITGLLDLSRIEAGHYVINVEEFDIEDIWTELELLFRIGLTGKKVDLSWEVKSPMAHLRTDKIKVKEILGNIVFNAVKYTERGKIQVFVSPAKGGEEVKIEVRDTGVGIPKESLEFIFEPFHQLKGSSRRAQGGVGLGLNIVKKLLNLLHGRIEVESEEGKGSTFTVRLPAHHSPSPGS